MRKVIAAIILCCGLNAAHAQFAAQWYFQNFTQNPQAIRQVYLTPLWNVAINGATNINVGQRQSKQTDSSGSLIVSNMIYGSYLVEFVGQNRTNGFTNCFDVSIATNSLVNAANYICVGTNSTDTSGFAYTKSQSNGRFMTNASPTSAGYVLTALDGIGNYDWEPGGGSGGGISIGQLNTTSNSIIGTVHSIDNTTSNLLQGKVNTTSNLLAIAIATKAPLVSPSLSGNVDISGDGALFRLDGTPSTSDGPFIFNSTVPDILTIYAPASGPAFSIDSNNQQLRAEEGWNFTGAAGGLTGLNGSQITSGTVPPAQLGSGSSITTKFLRGDSTWQTVSGAGTVTSVDVAQQGFSSSGAVTGSGTITLTQNATKNHLGFGETNIGFLAVTNTAIVGGTGIDATNVFQVNTLAGARKFLINTNGDTWINGTLYINGVPLLDGSALKASQYAATDVSTGLVSTLNGNQWTNLNTHFTNYGAITNIILPADGNNWTCLVTNGPHNFFSFGGNNMGAISIWITTNGDAALPPQVTFLGYSDTHTTNCIIDLQPWGGTNRVLAGKSEL
jgi:hypothetical protein